MVINQLPVVVGKPYKPRQSRVNERWEEVEPYRRNGTGWLERKASGEIVYHTPWLKTIKPFEMKPLKARVETSAKALVRLKKELVTANEHKRYMTDDKHANGFKMTATNGHWALMERADGLIGRGMDTLAIGPKHKLTVLDNSELYLAVKRAATMADEKSKTVFLIGGKSGLTVFSQDSEVGQFVETVSEVSTAPFIVALNYDYLEPVLGSWPLKMWVRDSESAVVFESDDWRVVVMPIRADFDGARKAIQSMA